MQARRRAGQSLEIRDPGGRDGHQRERQGVLIVRAYKGKAVLRSEVAERIGRQRKRRLGRAWLERDPERYAGSRSAAGPETATSTSDAPTARWHG